MWTRRRRKECWEKKGNVRVMSREPKRDWFSGSDPVSPPVDIPHQIRAEKVHWINKCESVSEARLPGLKSHWEEMERRWWQLVTSVSEVGSEERRNLSLDLNFEWWAYGQGQMRKWGGCLEDIKHYEVVPWWILGGGVVLPALRGQMNEEGPMLPLWCRWRRAGGRTTREHLYEVEGRDPVNHELLANHIHLAVCIPMAF